MIPIFIISYNRYTMLKQLVDKLIDMGQERLIIIDNNSTYEPLLKWFEHLPSEVTLIRMESNYGHTVIGDILWHNVEFMKEYKLDTQNYVYTDCDIMPIEECPNNFMDLFETILNKYPTINKVSFQIKIDDLPDHYKYKSSIIAWETQFWVNSIIDTELNVKLYKAAVDTVFSYRRGGTKPGEDWNCFRVGYPYIVRHLPWYLDMNNLDDEYSNYVKTSNQSASGARMFSPIISVRKPQQHYNDGGISII